MSLGFSIGEIALLGTFGWNVYKSCKRAGEEFRSITGYVSTLQNELRELADEASNPHSVLHRCSKDQQDELRGIVNACKSDLTDLEKVLVTYKSLRTANPRTRDMFGFTSEKQIAMKATLSTHSERLNLFLTRLNSGALGRIETTQEMHSAAFGDIKAKLELIHDDIRAGRKDPTLLSSVKEWGKLERELVDDNITEFDVELNKDKIGAWLEQIREGNESGLRDHTDRKPKYQTTVEDADYADDEDENVETDAGGRPNGARVGLDEKNSPGPERNVSSETQTNDSHPQPKDNAPAQPPPLRNHQAKHKTKGKTPAKQPKASTRLPKVNDGWKTKRKHSKTDAGPPSHPSPGRISNPSDSNVKSPSTTPLGNRASFRVSTDGLPKPPSMPAPSNLQPPPTGWPPEPPPPGPLPTPASPKFPHPSPTQPKPPSTSAPPTRPEASSTSSFPFPFNWDAEDIFSSFFGGASNTGQNFSSRGRPSQRTPTGRAPSRGQFQPNRNSSEPAVRVEELPVTFEDLFRGTTRRMVVKQNVADAITGRRTVQDRVFEVPIKKGLKAGSKIKYTKAISTSDGTLQDLHFVISYANHNHFRREGDDLRYTLHINMKELLCGFSKVIPTINGPPLKYQNSRPLQLDHLERFPGSGMPNSKDPSKFGDLIVDLNVAIPNVLTKWQKEALHKILPS